MGGGYHLNKPVISPEELLEIYNRESVLVAIGCDYDKEISAQLDDMGITDYVLLGEMLSKFMFLSAGKRIKSWSYLYEVLNYSNTFKNQISRYLAANPDENYLALCLPAKTGNHTMAVTLRSIGLDFYALGHEPELCKDFCDILNDKFCDSQIKIITAVRDPISQNLADMYQLMQVNPTHLRALTALIDNTEYLKSGADVQKLFNEVMEQYLNNKFPIDEKNQMYYTIQNFYSMMRNTDIGSNIFNREFDKDAGFAIYKEGNVEILVYQVEKLNVLWNEICNWLEIEQIPLVNENVGAEKWYAMSYRQAQKEIKITQEYFDKCYNEPYVKHFYSDEDIEKFKNRWKGHIVSDI